MAVEARLLNESTYNGYSIPSSNISSRSQSPVKSRFFPFNRLAKLIVLINCVLNQCQQLGSIVRKLNDKYPGSCLCLLQHWNRELYIIMLTVAVTR